MLSPEERQEIEAKLARYPAKQAVTIDALLIVQKQRGWVSDETLKDLAAFLGMTVEDLDGVATFYNLIFRKPVGRHVVTVCDSVSCWIMGYEKIRRRLTKDLGIELGQTTSDGRFTLLPIVCLGTCDHAPAMMVGRDLYRDLSPEKLQGILEKYR